MNNVEIKKYAARIFNVVEAKKREYEHRYKIQPRYVKLPIPIYAFLEVAYDYVNINKIMTLYGLQICPTYSIATIDEIEVF